LAGMVADQFAAMTVWEAPYEKVPMPGRLPSEEPAIEAPARMKAKARMKLIVRIFSSLRYSNALCAVLLPS
jgi:hypothetical protein